MKSRLSFTPSLLKRLREALREDIGSGDITTNLIIPKDFKINANLIVRENCVISGLVLLPKIFALLDRRVKVKILKKEGASIKKGTVVAKIAGPARVILTGERLAINFIAKLSGIATEVQDYVKRIRPYRCRLLATRKTTPLLRDLEKYAVECGGGLAHRHGLFDAYMVKDNHKEVLKRMGHKYSRYSARDLRKKRKKDVPFIVEVDQVKEISWALSFRPDMILLDNFKVHELKKAVRFVRELSKKSGVRTPLLEASGGINLSTVRKIASTGVDRLSVGAVTHSPRAIDYTLEVTA